MWGLLYQRLCENYIEDFSYIKLIHRGVLMLVHVYRIISHVLQISTEVPFESIQDTASTCKRRCYLDVRFEITHPFFRLVVVLYTVIVVSIIRLINGGRSTVCMDATVEQFSCYQIRHCAFAMLDFIYSTQYQMIYLGRYVSRVVQLNR